MELRYRLSDEGRIVLGQLTSEETLEFEVLSQQDRDGRNDLQSQLRLLELYVKYSGPASTPRHKNLPRTKSIQLKTERTMRRQQLPRMTQALILVMICFAAILVLAL
ncbi:hypothetical protein [Bradyrhizobium sp.]|uniref:hypothetical protein n=1 Tax=Bradyrhizobium sp. TaxID=376 RepID=UPI002DDCC7A1|nr:hypothetical protein [Bradyrhizobium sp.]HEV2153148.1 hypothetical protein [Bradyrhizobium sp.]